MAPSMNGQSAVTIIIVLSALYVIIGGLGGIIKINHGQNDEGTIQILYWGCVHAEIHYSYFKLLFCNSYYWIGHSNKRGCGYRIRRHYLRFHLTVKPECYICATLLHNNIWEYTPFYLSALFNKSQKCTFGVYSQIFLWRSLAHM